MPSSLVLACSQALADNNLRIAFAESATAGRLAAEFSLTPESGQVLLGGIVCYDANIKTDILGVPQTLIDKYTPESEEVTKSLALCFKQFMPADMVVAITGLTTPGGSESTEKPVGTIFAQGIFKDKPFGFRKVFSGSAEQIVIAAIDAVAETILELLSIKDR